ncbi:MAG: ribonuclease P protein component [Oscillospiraceae bacterium]|nr:ribonuclease P protein component [Oscillospiraceae bacterium]
MPAVQSLNQNKQFRTLYYHGKSAVHGAVVTYVRRNRENTVRLGITVSKKLGGAVVRNRCRRVLREGLRPLEPLLRPGTDIVLVARGRLIPMKSTQATVILKNHLQSLGALAQPGIKL